MDEPEIVPWRAERAPREHSECIQHLPRKSRTRFPGIRPPGVTGEIPVTSEIPCCCWAMARKPWIPDGFYPVRVKVTLWWIDRSRQSAQFPRRSRQGAVGMQCQPVPIREASSPQAGWRDRRTCCGPDTSLRAESSVAEPADRSPPSRRARSTDDKNSGARTTLVPAGSFPAELPRVAQTELSQAQLLERTATERAAAVARVGEAAVREYEEIRQRQRGATDSIARLAYELYERSLRTPFEAYALALGQRIWVRQARILAMMMAVVGPEWESRRGNDLESAGAVQRSEQFASRLFGAAERIAHEIDSEEAAGRAWGLVDSEEPCRWEAEPVRFEVALKALLWDDSPPLAALRRAAKKLLHEITPPFQVLAATDRRDIAEDFSRDLRALAQHLNLGIPDVIDSLTAAGLAMESKRERKDPLLFTKPRRPRKIVGSGGPPRDE